MPEDMEVIGWIGVRPGDEPGEWYFHFEDEDPEGFTEVREVYAPISQEATDG